LSSVLKASTRGDASKGAIAAAIDNIVVVGANTKSSPRVSVAGFALPCAAIDAGVAVAPAR